MLVSQIPKTCGDICASFVWVKETSINWSHCNCSNRCIEVMTTLFAFAHYSWLYGWNFLGYIEKITVSCVGFPKHTKTIKDLFHEVKLPSKCFNMLNRPGHARICMRSTVNINYVIEWGPSHFLLIICGPISTKQTICVFSRGIIKQKSAEKNLHHKRHGNLHIWSPGQFELDLCITSNQTTLAVLWARAVV